MMILLALPDDVLRSVLVDWLYLDSLAMLDSSCCSSLHRPALLNVFSMLKSLPTLKPPHFRDGSLAWLNARKMQVKHLVLVGNSDVVAFNNSVTIRDWVYCKSITTLTDAYITDTVALTIASKCPNIESLTCAVTLNPPMNFSTKSFSHILKNCAYLHCIRLERKQTKLTSSAMNCALSNTVSVHAMHLDALLTVAPNIASTTLRLCINNCFGVTRFNVDCVTTFTRLTMLSLRACTIDDAALVQICTACTLIQHLDLYHAIHLTAEGMLIIADKLIYIQSLNVEVTVVNDAFLCALAAARADTILALYVAGNWLVSELGMCAVTKCCTKLRVLSINSGLIMYTSNFGRGPNYRRLHTLIIKCSSCPSYLLTVIPIKCTSLVQLRIDTPDIISTDSYFVSLVEMCSELRTLVVVSNRRDNTHWINECSRQRVGITVTADADVLCYHVLDNPLCTF